MTRIPIKEKWLPLKEFVNRPMTNKPMALVIGNCVYIKDLETWIKDYPTDSIDQDDVLAHEYVHSVRQLNYGINKWILKYLINKEFRLYEEKLSYYVDIKRKLNRKVAVDKEFLAQNMSESYFGMITYNEAISWVQDVIDNKWTPRADELPIHPEIPQ